MIEKKSHSPGKRRTHTFVIILLVMCIMASVIELTAILILKSKNQKTFPFLISITKKEKIRSNLTLRYNYLDPHRGYSHISKMMRDKNTFYLLDGFAVYRDKEEKNGDAAGGKDK